VYCEQGLGDALQFSRYVPLLAEQGARVILEVQPPLVSLLASIKGVERVMAKSDTPPLTDFYIPLMSLPHLFGTTIMTIPVEVPYLVPPTHLVEHWRAKLDEVPGVRRIGLVWAANLMPHPSRSCPAEHLAPLFGVNGIRFHSLQIGWHDRLPLPPELAAQVVDLTGGLGDFADTAALVANLDLVITIDAAVAHLAGALGKPVWVLLPKLAEWRWLEGRNDSPWYPTMRLFRQQQPGDWPPVMDAVVRALREWLAEGTVATLLPGETLEPIFQTAMACLEQKAYDAAIFQFKKLLSQAPDEPAAWFNLGRAYLHKENDADAERCFRKVIELKPESPDAWLRLGRLCRERRDFGVAEAYLRKACELVPNSVDILLELGATLIPQDKTADAFDCCRKILAIRPDSVEAFYNMGYLQLRNGDYLAGFANFEARLGMESLKIDRRKYLQPRWDGSPLGGRSILVYGEQGMGDVIQFSRYLPLVAQQGGKVVFEVDGPLVPLFGTSFAGVAQVVPKSETPPMTDVYIQSLSLPHIFRTTLDTVPNRIPYLIPDPSKVAALRHLLADDSAFRVGLVWRGSSRNPMDQERSASLAAFSPLADLDGVSLYSLQVGPAGDDAMSPPGGMRLTDHTARLEDLSDTAAMIANLDLVISIDTAVAHLAGALGKPTWLLLAFVPDWRWLIGREDSPWYPTMRLFRQERPGDWSGVIERVRNALELLVQERTNEPGHMDVESLYQLGARLKERGDLVEAERCFRGIVEQVPDLPDPHHSLGVVLQLQERPAEAIGHYRTALALDPGFVKAHYNLATALWRSGLYQEAISSVHTTLALDPFHAEAHWLLGQLHLLTGHFNSGWEEYEWRWEVERFSTKKQNFEQPQWDGSTLAGKTLLIHMEQGRGDMIQFIRYAPLVAASGGRVVVCAVKELVSLLAMVEGVSLVVDREEILPAFDVHIPALSLPRVFGTTLENIPNKVPYLRPDPLKVEEWRQTLRVNPGFRVGIVWAGQDKPDPSRSIPLREYLPLLSCPQVEIHSLQFGKGTEEISALPEGCEIIDHSDRILGFANTAALIANLDLIISIDTVVAHLAAALGKPTWTLLPFVPEWRWLVGRDDSPWYPTMRLFRQQSPGDWRGVMDRVQEELARLLNGVAFHKQRGIELLRAGQAAEAEQAFSAAITHGPADAEAYSNLGVTLDCQKRYGEALAAYRTALNLRPDFVQALFNMGNTYRNLGENPEARTCYEKALALFPGLVQAELCLAQVWKEEGDYIRARERLERALAHEPGNADALHGLGETYQAEERFPEAIAAYQGALVADPGHIKALNMLGSVFHLVGKFDAAEECYRKALALKPDTLTVLNNLGAVYQSQGRFAESVTVLRRAIAVDPGYADGHWNLALSLLACGEYHEGWQEYEWRFKKSNPVPEKNYSQPRWDGSPLDGRTILLHCEQGFGDTIQFIRYASLAARQGGRVVVECQAPALKRLVADVAGVSAVVAAAEPLPPFDCHAPLLSLPLIFRTTFADIPAELPYLHADPGEVATWRARLGSSAGLKVGLVWAGRRNLALNRKRTCNLDSFAPLAAVRNTIFYSLQVGDGAEQAAAPPAGMRLEDMTQHIRDFADTAALIANLDLVISIDTAVAHLAGAMGKPTWLLLPYAADWRWLQDHEDAPWYPGMRLFRQPMAGDWQEVMGSVATALQQHGRTSSVGLSDRIFQRPAQAKPIENRHAGTDRRAASLKIGLAWAGRKSHPLDHTRSCPLAVFAPLAAFENATFFSLQPSDGSEQTTDLPPGMVLKDLGGHIHDFEDTAALIANLDLIFTIDTSVAHLAGAMGKPTWLLLPYVADWRWMADRDDSPWYPTMKLFRQPEPGEWDAVIRAVAASLARLSGGGTDEFGHQQHYCGSVRTTPEQTFMEEQLEGYLRERARNTISPDAHLNVGAALALLGRYREAIHCCRRALELSPGYVQAHLNLGFSLLALGEFAEGWQHHEWRHRLLDSALPPWPLLTRSNFGMHSRGTTLLVHCEQGYGDTLQFMRYIPLLSDMGYHITVTCQGELGTLMGIVRGVSRVVPHGEMLPVCDFQVLLLTLPYLFNTVLDTIPGTVPYLAPRPHKVAEWRSRL
jgi:tetratricopeptide (TPR) repeat protein